MKKSALVLSLALLGACVSPVMLTATAKTTNTATLSKSCETDLKNVLEVMTFGLVCMQDDDQGWGSAEDQAFDNMMSQIENSCADASDQAMERLGERFYADLEKSIQGNEDAHCKTTAPKISKIINQYK